MKKHMEYFEKQFKNYEVIEDTSNSDLCNIADIRLINLFDYLVEHRIKPWDFAKRDEKLKEQYTLCNLKTLEFVWSLGKKGLPKEWRKNILFLGTKIVQKDEDDDGSIEYPILRYVTSYNRNEFFLGKHHDITSYHMISKLRYHVAVF